MKFVKDPILDLIGIVPQLFDKNSATLQVITPLPTTPNMNTKNCSYTSTKTLPSNIVFKNLKKNNVILNNMDMIKQPLNQILTAVQSDQVSSSPLIDRNIVPYITYLVQNFEQLYNANKENLIGPVLN
jgi:hypothetical protein